MTQKDALLDKIEDCCDHQLDFFCPRLRERLARRLSRRDLTALRDAFMLAYQEGFQRAELRD
jgi:hypothetical protein